MNLKNKTKAQLIEEIRALQAQSANLQQLIAENQRQQKPSSLELDRYVTARTANLQHANSQLATLYHIGQLITSELQLDKVLSTIAKSTAQLLNTDTGVILLIDPAKQLLHIKGAYGLSRKMMQNTADKIGESIAGRVVKTGKPIIANDLPHDARFSNPAAADEGLLACASVPLKVGREIIGTLDVHSKVNPFAFDESHIQILEMLASQAAIAIVNARLYEELQSSNEELETRILKRTADLTSVNQKLQQEIAERLQIEQTLVEERNLLRTLFDNLPDFIYVKDLQSRFLANNSAHAKSLGVDNPQDMLGKTDFDYFPPEMAQGFYNDEQQIFKTGQPLIDKEEIIEVHQNKTVSRIWVEASKVPFYNAQGQIAGLVGISRDVTQRKKLEIQIKQLLERRDRQVKLSTQIAQSIATAPALTDLYHMVVNLIQEQFGYYHVHIYTFLIEDNMLVMQEGTGAPGATMKEKGHKISLNAEKSLVAQAARHKEAVLVSDVTKVSHWLPNPLLPETKSEIAVPIIFREEILGVLDIQNDKIDSLNEEDQILLSGLCGQIAIAIHNHRLQLKRQMAEAQLKKYAAELEQSNRELENFAYISSHDLQEPLRKIQAFGDRLHQRYYDVLDERGRDYLERMQSAAARSQILIHDLLAFSRITSKANPFLEVDLNEIVQGVLSDLETSIEQSSAQIKVSPLPVITADETQMRQLFQNLVSNAIKFQKEGQTPVVTIKSQLIQSPEKAKAYYQITVADNGIGFDEKYLDRIFTVFQRLHTRSEYEGTGIGLAICRKIAERHKGELTATSSPGQGSAFIITLPQHIYQD